MRLFFMSMFLSVTTLAAPRPVVALLPPVSTDDDLRGLGYLIEARASELLEQTGTFSELHVKQVLAMAGGEGLDVASLSSKEALASTRSLLGASVVTTSTLTADAKGITLSGSVFDGKKTTPYTAKLPVTWPEALVAGSEALAKAVAGKPVGKKTVAQPESSSPEALRALSQCYAIVIEQPLGIDAPVVLEGDTLRKAASLCEKALSNDPKLRFASAVLALATAIIGDSERATAALNALGADDDMVEPFTLARFWMVTRFQSNEAGVASLNDVLKRHPGELIAAGYLAETLSVLNQHAESEAAWKAYLALVPNSPFAHGKLSRALARQNRHDDAIAAAKKAVELAPQSRVAKVELAGRYIDAGKVSDAITLLSGIEKKSAEATLRLGWAHWLQGEVDTAATQFQAALAAATTPAEWRTRGRAHANLALVAAKRGKPEEARAALVAAMETGYSIRQVDPLLEPVVKKLNQATPTDAGARRSLLPTESSLIPFDATGSADLTRAKEARPTGFVLYKF